MLSFDVTDKCFLPLLDRPNAVVPLPDFFESADFF